MNDLRQCDLIIDAIYKGGRRGNAGDDPLNSLLGVSNQGGFRYLGPKKAPYFIVLTSNFNDPDWPDHFDRETGILTYYGDNKKPGRLLHDTPRFGNELLRESFNLCHSGDRNSVAPFFVFSNTGNYRDVTFLGLAVPGAIDVSDSEDLVAVWKSSDGKRFQNYRATFSILDSAVIKRAWIEDLKGGLQLTKNCPVPLQHWKKTGSIEPLIAEASLEYRKKAEQLPCDTNSQQIVFQIRDHFADWPVGFEACAAHLTRIMDSNFVSHELTRPSRDGGRDVIGEYRIGLESSAILVDYALEAKCYAEQNSVGVRELSRLISRLRHRQFGILVTTSYVNTQAYKEIKEDGHPIVVIAATDIVSILKRAGMNEPDMVQSWLEANFPKTGESKN